jgi:hypothetical protein
VRLRERIVALAQRYRRYGANMIYLKLRQAGERVNHKRVERLYALEKLQVEHGRQSSDAGPRPAVLAAWSTESYPIGQWTRVHRQGDGHIIAWGSRFGDWRRVSLSK